MAFSITGQIKVATLKKRFLNEFGLTLRVYDGRSFADEGQTISQIRKKKGSGDLSVRKSMKVGTLEDKIESEFGIKVQIAGSDDSYLCKNELTLASASEKDQEKIMKMSGKDKQVSSKGLRKDSSPRDKASAGTLEGSSKDVESNNEGEPLKYFVKTLFELASIPSDVFDESPDTFKLYAELKSNIDKIEENLSDADGEKIIGIAKDISQEVKVADIWKFALIFQTLEDIITLPPEVENGLNNVTRFADSWESAIALLSKGLSDRNISDDSSEDQMQEASDFALGCFFIGIEMSITYLKDGEFVPIFDEKGIEAWVLGYGNPVEYSDPVGDILMNVTWNLRDYILLDWRTLLQCHYNSKIPSVEEQDDEVDWNEISDEFKMML